MTVKERNDLIRKVFDKCNNILDMKGHDYATKKANDNFVIAGEMLGMHKYYIWMVYFYKHLSAVFNYCRNGKLESEPIEERIIDSINYLAILATMILEDTIDGKVNK